MPIWSYWVKFSNGWDLIIEDDKAKIDEALLSNVLMADLAKWDALSQEQMQALYSGVRPHQLGALEFYPLNGLDK